MKIEPPFFLRFVTGLILVSALLASCATKNLVDNYKYVSIDDLIAHKSKYDGERVLIGPLWVGCDGGDSFIGYQSNRYGKHLTVYWQEAKNQEFFKNLKGFSSSAVFVKGIYYGSRPASVHAEEGFYKESKAAEPQKLETGN